MMPRKHGASETWAGEDRVEFRPLGEIVLLDHFAREIARENELHLARDRFLIDGGRAIGRLLGIGPQEDVLVHFEQHAGFRLVARRDVIDAGKRDGGGQKGEAEDQEFLAPKRAAQRSEVDVTGRRETGGSVRLYA